MKIEWKPIPGSWFVTGKRATNGRLEAEIVRAYLGVWHWFPYRDGRPVVAGEAEPLPYEEAKAKAEAYLRGDIDLSHLPLAKGVD